MTRPLLVAVVVRPPRPTATPWAIAEERAFWSRFERSHVHDFKATTMPTVFACVACGKTLRRIK